MRLCLLENKVCSLVFWVLMFSEYVLLATQPIFTEESGLKEIQFAGAELRVSCGLLEILIAYGER